MRKPLLVHCILPAFEFPVIYLLENSQQLNVGPTNINHLSWQHSHPLSTAWHCTLPTELYFPQCIQLEGSSRISQPQPVPTNMGRYQLLYPFILYSKVKLACSSRYLLTSYICIPVPYDEKDIFFFVVSFRSSIMSSQNHSTSTSLALLVRAQIWITVILNGLPWKRTVIICHF